MRITAKRHPVESGLRRMFAGERGWTVKIDGERIGEVGHGRLLEKPYGYWYYVVGSDKHGVPRVNTASSERFETGEAARDAALAYVKKHARCPNASQREEG